MTSTRNPAQILRLSQSARTLNFTQKRTSFYNRYKHGPTSISNPRPDYVGWVREFFTREGFEYMKCTLKRCTIDRFLKKSRMNFEPPPNKVVKFEEFDNDEKFKQWRPVADSDSLNGFSTSNFTRTPAGHARFWGFLDTRIPDDGLTVNSGFAGVIGPRKPSETLIPVDNHWNWEKFNTIEIKFRGDGRKYNFMINTGTYSDDQSYYDTRGFPLYTKGGPHWQTVRLPFTKLIYVYKGLVQDRQHKMPLHRIQFIAFNLQDGVDGPFSLEIKHIGLMFDTTHMHETNSAYENYFVEHMRYRHLQVDCDPPETQ